MFGQRETVGHSGDKVADPPRPFGLAFGPVFGRQPFGGHRSRIALIACKEIEYELFGIPHHPHHPFVPVHMQLQEFLDRGFRASRLVRKDNQRLVLIADLFGRRRPSQLQTAMRLDHDSANEMGNQFAHQFGAAPALVKSGILGVDLRDHRGRERNLLEIVDRKQACAQTVIDVMRIIGDVVGDRSDLGFQRGETP